MKNIMMGLALILTACGLTARGATTTKLENVASINKGQASDQFVTPNYDPNTAIKIVKNLSSDAFEGRAVGSQGGAKARNYLKTEIQKLGGFISFSEQSFSFILEGKTGNKTIQGVNLIGKISGGTKKEGSILLITAHYDHLGIRKNEIYNGADDNASGVGALFAIAQSFQSSPPQNDIFIIWLDGEERGLQGAHALIKMEAFKNRPVLNFNLDMVGQNTKNELYASGTFHTSALKPYINRAALGTGLNLRFGHDRPEQGYDDWTLQSDHGVFHEAGIPFIYFGVEDHPYYHKPTDTFEVFPVEFYKKSLKAIVNTAHILDADLQNLAKPLQ